MKRNLIGLTQVVTGVKELTKKCLFENRHLKYYSALRLRTEVLRHTGAKSLRSLRSLRFKILPQRAAEEYTQRSRRLASKVNPDLSFSKYLFGQVGRPLQPLASHLGNLAMALSLCACLIQLSFSANAQEFKINKVEMTPETIILHYNLLDTTKDRAYVVNVYSSRDQFIAPLQKVKGDMGIGVRPGANKRIEWNSKEELGAEFEGGFELEIRGRVYIPFIAFENLPEGTTFKKGVAKKLTWTGGSKQYLNFLLYKDGKQTDIIFPNISNSHEYDIVMPKSIKPGKGYSFVVTDSKNKDQVMKTSTFQVKRKYPLVLLAAPVAAIGAGIYFLLPKKTPTDLEGPLPPPDDTN